MPVKANDTRKKMRKAAMNTTLRLSFLASAALISFSLAGAVQAQQNAMSFFITSEGPGKGGDIGGLAGADAHCQKLATAVGAGGKTWRAYLSTNSTPAQAGINARDRIGSGPWYNAKGVLIAKDVEDLHANAQINKANGLNEKGEPTKVRGDNPNQHDILTGSTMDGRSYPPNLNLTCNNWTSGNFGSAMLGHSDREGIADTIYQHSWNAAHM
jgi:hypothetical protein